MSDYKVPSNISLMDMSQIASWGYFHVGGKYVLTDSVLAEAENKPKEKHVMVGQVYVEVYVPKNVTKKYPLVFLPGNNQTSLTWKNTPDGRKGWAQYFWEQGYVVYLVDVPLRGRADAFQDDEKKFIFSVEKCEYIFGGKENPECTQWFGEPVMGDPTFDAFYATIYPSSNDNKRMQEMIQEVAPALMEKIGPAILFTHSQSGPFGWIISDACPGQVKGLVQLEPKGPPFHDDSLRRSENAVWGLTEIPLHYEPKIDDYRDLVKVERIPDDPNLRRGYVQGEPYHTLPNLADVKMCLITGNCSKHRQYDYLTIENLKQVGVKHLDHIRLVDKGQFGNEHMMMIEKNNLEIAAIAKEWIENNIDV